MAMGVPQIGLFVSGNIPIIPVWKGWPLGVFPQRWNGNHHFYTDIVEKWWLMDDSSGGWCSNVVEKGDDVLIYNANPVLKTKQFKRISQFIILDIWGYTPFSDMPIYIYIHMWDHLWRISIAGSFWEGMTFVDFIGDETSILGFWVTL